MNRKSIDSFKLSIVFKWNTGHKERAGENKLCFYSKVWNKFVFPLDFYQPNIRLSNFITPPQVDGGIV